MTVQAWPFLIGRTRNAVYRVVVAPGFMVDRQVGSVLSRIDVGHELPPEHALMHELRGFPGGPVTAVYRTSVAKAVDYGLGGDELLKDGSGRRILVTEGVVLAARRGRVARVGLGVDDLARAHQELVAAYRTFWDREEAFPRNHPSAAFPVAGTGPGRPAVVLEDRGCTRVGEPPAMASLVRFRRPVGIAVAAAVVLGAACAVVARVVCDSVCPPSVTRSSVVPTQPPEPTERAATTPHGPSVHPGHARDTCPAGGMRSRTAC